MSSTICFNLDQSEILSSGSGLNLKLSDTDTGPLKKCFALPIPMEVITCQRITSNDSHLGQHELGKPQL